MYEKIFCELVREIRLRHALSMLLSTNVKIGHIGYSLGHKNEGTFILCFKKAFSLGGEPKVRGFRYANKDRLRNFKISLPRLIFKIGISVFEPILY